MRSLIHYFGVKYRVADAIWQRLGAQTPLVIDPFAGSLSLFLARPNPNNTRYHEIINDADGFVVNFWRSIQRDPDRVKRHLKTPVMEAELTARHIWLRNQAQQLQLSERLSADVDYYHPDIAGWWAWGHNAWIGSGWCSPSQSGPWIVRNGKLTRADQPDNNGVTRKMPYTMSYGRGTHALTDSDLDAHIAAVSNRIRYMQILCGDWQRALPDSLLENTTQPIAIFLDPPYSHANRNTTVYQHDDPDIAAQVRAWAIRHGNSPHLRIACCGFADRDHDFPPDWERLYWNTSSGYAGMRKYGLNQNRFLECITFSPHCFRPVTQLPLL